MVVKNPVRLLSSSNVSLATTVAGSTIDGKELRLADRVLLIAQTTGVENGIYVVGANGLERSDDLPVDATATGVYVFVDEGDQHVDRSYICITDRINPTTGANTCIVGTHATEWVTFGARPSAMAGNGLVVGSGNALDVQVDTTTIEIVSDTVRIKNPDIKFKVERGLLRSVTDGTTPGRFLPVG
jgi:hypothetical protein